MIKGHNNNNKKRSSFYIIESLDNYFIIESSYIDLYYYF